MTVQQPTFLVLTALSAGPLHGYAIIAEVTELSGGRATMRVGTLYAALDRLAREGMVAVDGEEVVNGRLRRRYRITGEGERALSTEATTLAALAEQATRRLRRPRVTPRPGPAGATR